MRIKHIAAAAVVAAGGTAGVMALPTGSGAVTAHSVRLTGIISGPNLISVDTSVVSIIAQNDNTKQIQGNVVCFSVSGNQAFVVYQDTTDAKGGYVRIVDNGPAGTNPVDQQNNGRLTAAQVTSLSSSCPVPTSGKFFKPAHTLLSGEAIVS